MAFDRDSLPGLLGHCGRLAGMIDAGNRGQGRILRLLAERENVTQSELLEAAGVRPGSLSEVLGRMEARGLIVRRPDEADRRRSVITVTDAGREAAKVQGDGPDLFAALTAEEQDTLRTLLKKLSDSLEPMVERPPRRREHPCDEPRICPVPDGCRRKCPDRQPGEPCKRDGEDNGRRHGGHRDDDGRGGPGHHDDRRGGRESI